VSFGPVGDRLAGCTRRQVVLWNFSSLRQVIDLPLNTFESDYAYNPRVRYTADGKIIFANQADGTVRFWGNPNDLHRLQFPSP